MEQLNKNIHFRITENEKNKIDMVLTDINKNSNDKKGYRFLIMEFVNNYLENNSIGLEYQKQQLLKEIQEQENEKNKLISSIQENEIKIKAIDNELNNISLFDISNYKTDKAMVNVFNRLKEIVFTNRIVSIEDLEPDIKQCGQAYKIKDKETFKNVVLNHFPEWKKELLLMDPEPEPDKNEIKEKITKIIIRKYKDPRNQTKDLDKFLNQTHIKEIIKSFIKNNSQYDLNETEIIECIKNKLEK